jgi:hypothetical protein
VLACGRLWLLVSQHITCGRGLSHMGALRIWRDEAGGFRDLQVATITYVVGKTPLLSETQKLC